MAQIRIPDHEYKERGGFTSSTSHGSQAQNHGQCENNAESLADCFHLDFLLFDLGCAFFAQNGFLQVNYSIQKVQCQQNPMEFTGFFAVLTYFPGCH